YLYISRLSALSLMKTYESASFYKIKLSHHNYISLMICSYAFFLMKLYHSVKLTLDNLKPSPDNILSLILFLALNLSNQPKKPLNVSSEWFLAISYAFINTILSDSTQPFSSKSIFFLSD
ncbi:hypothetical protein CDIK_4452, partial [Cucumispora dikerogammari]